MTTSLPPAGRPVDSSPGPDRARGPSPEPSWEPHSQPSPDTLRRQAHHVRELVIEMCASDQGGHLGGALSVVDILVTLYFDVLRVDPGNPTAQSRDILLLSKGHAGIGLYAVLAARGFFPEAELASYGSPGSRLSAHPTPAVPGIEAPTGSLGHGLPLGVGYALAARLDGTSRRCVVILGDGELQEGSTWEAAMFAGARGLGQLVAIVDRNRMQITGATEDVVALEPLADRWHSFGWAVHDVDGHDIDGLRSLFRSLPRTATTPTVVIANTVKGRGLPFVEGQIRSHYARLGQTQRRRALAALARTGSRRR